MALDILNLLFLLSASAFNLLIPCILIAQETGHGELRRRLGAAWLSLIIPLAIVFGGYAMAGRERWLLLCFGLVFLYMFVEWLLDYAWKIDFRRHWRIHVPYIVLEYLALFSLIAIAFSIDRIYGWLVSISFWILMAVLVYLYAVRPRGRARLGK